MEADPAEVNLSAFETVFDEKRPFFTEGRQVFAAQGATYFYSRRIGARPRGVADGLFVDYPQSATILGAAKLTGRLDSGLSIGALAAVTDREEARIFTPGLGPAAVRVAPLAGYGVVRAQQQFGAAASTAGGILTAVHRDFDARDPLSAVLTRDAFSGGADSTLRLKGGAYEIAGHLGFSHVAGEPAAILRLQRSSARYLQRPDADYVEEDPRRTSLSGFTGGLSAAKVSGTHWLWTAEAEAESPGFEINDAGQLATADGLSVFGQLKYRETTPGRRLHGYSVSLNTENEWNYDRDRQFGAIRSDATLTFRNFWQANLTAWVDLRAQDERLTRGGPSMGTPRAWVTIAELNSGFQARNRWSGRVYYGENELGGQTYRLSGSVSFRPGPSWQVTLDPNYLRDKYPQQYVDTLAGGRPETYGRRYVFGFIDRSTLLAQIRVSCTLKPDLTIDLYAEPFAASGRYLRFGELAAPRRRDLRVYGTDGTTVTANPDGSKTITDGAQSFTLDNGDFNVRSFRSQPGAALGVAAGQPPVRGLAAGPVRPGRAGRAGGPRRPLRFLPRAGRQRLRGQGVVLAADPLSVARTGTALAGRTLGAHERVDLQLGLGAHVHEGHAVREAPRLGGAPLQPAVHVHLPAVPGDRERDANDAVAGQGKGHLQSRAAGPQVHQLAVRPPSLLVVEHLDGHAHAPPGGDAAIARRRWAMAAVAEDALAGGQQIAHRERLLDVRGDSGLGGAEVHLGLRVHGDHHDRGRRGQLLDAPEHGPAVEAGQHEVEHHQLRPEGVDLLDGVRPVRGHGDLVPAVGKDPPHEGPEVVIILDDQHFHLIAPGPTLPSAWTGVQENSAPRRSRSVRGDEGEVLRLPHRVGHPHRDLGVGQRQPHAPRPGPRA